MTRKSFVASISLAFAATMSVGFVNITPKVIYGEDGRQDVYEVEHAAIRDLADSTVALISNGSLTRTSGGMVSIKANTFGKEMRLCSSEPYANQPAAANCSGALVGEDLVATAGHCISSSNCSRWSFVFGFKMSDATTVANISADDVYACREVLAREYTNAQDYALVKLDRPVRGHRPLTLSRTAAQPGDEVFVIGHPAGIPTKVTSGANVRSQKGKFFVANLDTYGGNSGSAVFSAATHEVVGILVRGENDFVSAPGGSCRVSNVCEENSCRGEDVTNISYISQALRRAGH